LAGVALAAGLWGVRDKRERRRQEEAARRLWFAREREGEEEDDGLEDDKGMGWGEAPDAEAGDVPWQEQIDRLCDALFHGKEDADLFVPNSDVDAPRSAGHRERVRPAVAVPVALAAAPKVDAPKSSSPAEPADDVRHARPLRWLWLAACLLLSSLCLWKSAPEKPIAPSLQAAESAASVQLAAEDARPRYVTEDIERLRIGDSVLAMDPATGEVRQHRVVDHFQRTAYELRVLEFIGQDGTCQRIETTGEHPFWVVAKGGFVRAGELEIGDEFLGPAGEIQILAATRVEEHPEGVPVFNFEVENAHTYFVLGEDLQGDPLLVHNATARECGRIGEKGVKGWLKRNGYTNIRSIQNRSGHGIDIVAERNGHYYFFEVKSSQTGFAPSLSRAQANGRHFVRTRLERAMGRGRFWRTTDSHISDDAWQIYDDIYISGKPYHGRVIDLTNIGQGGMTGINILPWW
jgi:hypothetical protein